MGLVLVIKLNSLLKLIKMSLSGGGGNRLLAEYDNIALLVENYSL